MFGTEGPWGLCGSPPDGQEGPEGGCSCVMGSLGVKEGWARGLTCPANKNNDGADKMDVQYLVLAVFGPRRALLPS